MMGTVGRELVVLFDLRGGTAGKSVAGGARDEEVRRERFRKVALAL